MNGHPSKIEQSTWRMPSGYANQNQNKPVREIVSSDGSVSTFPVDDAPVAQAEIITPLPMADASSDIGVVSEEIYFIHGSARLTNGEKRQIKSFANTVGPNTAITVVGHASTRVDTTDDPVRRKTINFEVAQKRADAVTRVLNSAGVNPSMVQAISRGDDEPNPNPGSRSQEAADRRVQIYTK
jgi:outer membrane protein OmpA-like peptidoglycan-associated protein